MGPGLARLVSEAAMTARPSAFPSTSRDQEDLDGLLGLCAPETLQALARDLDAALGPVPRRPWWFWLRALLGPPVPRCAAELVRSRVQVQLSTRGR